MSLFETVTQVGQFLLFFFIGVLSVLAFYLTNKLLFALIWLYKTHIQLKLKILSSYTRKRKVIRLNTQLETQLAKKGQFWAEISILESVAIDKSSDNEVIEYNSKNICSHNIKLKFLQFKLKKCTKSIIEIKSSLTFYDKIIEATKVKNNCSTIFKNMASILFYIFVGVIFVIVHLYSKYMNFFIFLPIATLCGIFFGYKIIDIFHCK